MSTVQERHWFGAVLLTKRLDFEDRHGTRRVSVPSVGDLPTNLPEIPWSDDFMRRYASALEGATQPAVVGSTRTIAGSFDPLIVSYYRSPEFHSLKATAQKVRRNHQLIMFYSMGEM